MSDRNETGAGQEAAPVPAEAKLALLDITHRRNRLAGLWAAELLGLFGHAAQDYVRNVMHPGHAQEEVHGDDQETVVGKLAKDLADYVTLTEIREKMTQFLGEARAAKPQPNPDHQNDETPPKAG